MTPHVLAAIAIILLVWIGGGLRHGFGWLERRTGLEEQIFRERQPGS